jgi:DNA mismatch repair ATPase MutS
MSLGKNEQLYLLTGANMTGKSTFIRTIGVNLILAYLGVPVRARSFIVPLLRIYTAIRISDSVQDDISYFKAELNRMQQLMQTVKDSDIPYFILLDEPLRGTNSTDKQLGTQSIMEKLLQFNAIGIVATHDTGLCRLEQAHPRKISNYHFESEVTDAGLKFDFKLKPGGSTSNNATILMKLMGIVS